MVKYFFIFAVAVSIFGFTSQARACADGEEQVCRYVTEQVCGYYTDWVCDNKYICDPDGSNCRYEYQCGFETVYACRDQSNYVCECVQKPGESPGDTCLNYTCNACVNYRQYCGTWDRCNERWLDGSYKGCAPRAPSESTAD